MRDTVFGIQLETHGCYVLDTIRQPYAESSRRCEEYSVAASKIAAGTVQPGSKGMFPESWFIVTAITMKIIREYSNGATN